MNGPIDEDISVEHDALRLVVNTWQGERYLVTTFQVVGTPPTRWWDGESERTFMRVTAGGRLYELYFEHDRQTWVLARRLS